MNYGKLLIGFVVLVVSAGIMMHGAMALSSRIGISSMVIAMSVLTLA